MLSSEALTAAAKAETKAEAKKLSLHIEADVNAFLLEVKTDAETEAKKLSFHIEADVNAFFT